VVSHCNECVTLSSMINHDIRKISLSEDGNGMLAYNAIYMGSKHIN